MAKLGDLVVNIGANSKDLNKKLGRVRRDMRQLSSNFTAVGQSMTRSLTMPLALVGGAAVKLAVDFESAMAQVKAVSGATAGDFKRLEQSAKDLGASTVFTAREVAALQLEFSRLGFSADEIIQVQEATLNLAQATGSDLAQAAEVAGATLRAFGMDASETGKVTDVMAASFSASALNINTFQDSMKFVAPDAKAAGVSLEEVSAMLAVLANSGIKGSQAGTALRRILQEMTGTSGTLTERFAELAAKGIGVQGAMDEVGRRAGTSLLVLTEGVDQVNDLTSAFENSEGAAKDMADVMNDTAKGQLKAMTSALEGAGIALGEVLIPFVTDAANFVRELATKFKELSKDTQENIVKAAAFVAALGPMLIIIPKIVQAITLMRVAAVATTGAITTMGTALLAAFGAKSLLGPTKYIAGLRTIIKTKNLLLAGLQRIPIVAAGAFAFAGIKHAVDEINTAREAIRRYNEHKQIMLDLERETAEFLEGENTRLANQSAAIKGTSQEVQDYTGTLEVLTLENARFWEAYESGEAALSQTEGSVKLSKDAYDLLKKKIGEMIPMAEDMLPHALAQIRHELEQQIEKLSKAAEETEVYADATKSTAGSINALKDKIKDLREKLDDSVIGSDEYITNLALWKAATEELETVTKSFNETLEESEDNFPTGSLGSLREQLGSLRDELESLIPGTQAFIDKMAEIDGVAEQIDEATGRIEDSFEDTNNSLISFAGNVETQLSNATASMLSNMGQMIGGAKMGAEGLLEPLANMAIQLGELAIGYGVAVSGIKQALKSLNPVAAIVAGVALVALGTALKGKLSSIAEGEHNMPELAEGGLAFGPTTALIGDNKNARIDPEVVAPLSKLRNMLGGANTNVYGRISGDDIVISNDRATRDRNRYS